MAGGVKGGWSMYELHIANKHYSSWSLRPWALMRELGIEFREHLCSSLARNRAGVGYSKISPAAKFHAWSTAASWSGIRWRSVEYLAERA